MFFLMKGKIFKTLLLTVILSIVTSVLVVIPGSASSDFVATHGQLQVIGNQLCNQYGQPIQLRGMSSHGLQWYPQFVNYDSLKTLRDDWGMTVFRAAMYTDSKGYIHNPSVKNKVIEAVEICIDLGIYVIIDWHILEDGDPNMYKNQAKDFFNEMSSRFGNYPNVIYEICNEPNGWGVSWDGQIKPYAEEVIPVIRANDPDGIVLVGTSMWSQDIHNAADNPLRFDNVMYTLHFYSGTHGHELRSRIDYAMSKNAAIFVSEWGTSDASGDGGPFIPQAQEWIDFLNQKNVSWVNWSLCDKAEASAALNPGSSAHGGWNDSNLTQSGRFVKTVMKQNYNPPVPPTTTPPPTTDPTIIPQQPDKKIPGVIEAENYDQMSGIELEPCTEGGENVGYIDVGDWLDYVVTVFKSGTYKVEFRIASESDSGKFSLRSGNNVLTTVTVPNTGGWQNWTTISSEVNLDAGNQTIRLYADGELFNINWMSFELKDSPTTPPPTGNYTLGDINNDGYINSMDYTLMGRYILEIIDAFPFPEGKLAADVNGDGIINSGDAILLSRYLLGIIDSF